MNTPQFTLQQRVTITKDVHWTDDNDQERITPAPVNGTITAIDPRPDVTIYEIILDNNTGWFLHEPTADGPIVLPLDPRQAILARLRTLDLTKATDLSLVGPDYLKGYTRAVIAVCRALEETAAPDELWEGGIPAADLKPTDNLGEHLAATRRYFGLIP